MKKTILATITVASIFMGWVNTVSAASFDCSKATTQTEVAICNDPELSALDDLMAEVWLKGKEKHDLFWHIYNQKEWLVKRDECLDIECLKTEIRERISDLKLNLNPSKKKKKSSSYSLGTIIVPPSFDCSKATTTTENAICNDPELSTLDRRMGSAYKRATSINPQFKDPRLQRVALEILSDLKERTPLPLEEHLRKVQIEKLKEQRQCGGDKVCLKSFYKTRLDVNSLASFLDPIPVFDRLNLLELASNDYPAFFNTYMPIDISFPYAHYCIGLLRKDPTLCSGIFSLIASLPKQATLLSVGDGSRIEIMVDNHHYIGSYADEARDFIYDWEDGTQVYYQWLPEFGLKVFNAKTNESAWVAYFQSYKGLNLDAPHPIDIALEDCMKWGWQTNNFLRNSCKLAAISLWKQELERKYKGANEAELPNVQSFFKLIDSLGYMGRIEMIKTLTDYIPEIGFYHDY